MEFRLPQPFIKATTSPMTMGHLMDRKNHERDRNYFPSNDPTEWLLGYRMPPFQRQAVWTKPQKIRFIESAWLGFHLGTYVVNRLDIWVNNHPHPFDLWLIDGQQRLRALKSYLENEIKVFDFWWSDLNVVEQRVFDSVMFAQSIVVETDEEKLRVMYDRLNFGGTPHKKSQRATTGALK